MSRCIAAALGVRRLRKDIPDGVESLQVSGRIRARGASDGRLIDDDHFADVFIAFQSVAELFHAPAILFGRERFVQNIMDQRGFARPADSRNDNERAERNHHIQILKIVQVRAVQPQEFSCRLVPDVWHRNAQFPAEVAPRQRFMFRQHRLIRTSEEQLPAEFPRSRSKIDDAIRRSNRVLVVFDDEHGVPQVAQRFQDINQPLRVTRMKTDRRLIQHVQRTDQMRTKRCRKLNALRFSAGKRGRQTIQRQVIQPNFIQELQARADFLEDLFRNFPLAFGKLQRREGHTRFLHCEFADFRDRSSRHANRSSFRAQARPAALRTSGVAAIAAQENANMEFVLLALQPVEKSLHAFVVVF